MEAITIEAKRQAIRITIMTFQLVGIVLGSGAVAADADSMRDPV